LISLGARCLVIKSSLYPVLLRAKTDASISSADRKRMSLSSRYISRFEAQIIVIEDEIKSESADRAPRDATGCRTKRRHESKTIKSFREFRRADITFITPILSRARSLARFASQSSKFARTSREFRVISAPASRILSRRDRFALSPRRVRRDPSK